MFSLPLTSASGSLNDVVSGITGVQVRETVPDPFFDAADDVVLVDPPLTICASGSMRAKSTSAARPSALSKTFPQGQSDCAARAHPCAAPPTASMSRCAPGATARTGRKSGTPRCDPALYRAQHRQRKAGAPPPGSPPAWAASGMRWMSDPFPAPAAGRPAAGYSRRAASGPRSWGQKPPPSPTRRKRKQSSITPANITSAKSSLAAKAKRRWWDRSGFADRLARHAPDLDLVVIALDEKPFPLPHAPALAVGAGEMAPAAAGLRGGGGAMRHHYPGGHAVVDGFRSRQPGDALSAGVVIIALVYGRWPSVLATVINVISFDLFFCRPARDAGGVGCPVSAHLRRDAHPWACLSATSPPACATRRGWRATVNAVPAICMRCLKRWRWVAASRISPPPASDLSPPPFRPAASCCSDAAGKTAALNPPARADTMG